MGVCAMAKKSQSKPMKEILTRLGEFEYLKMLVFPEEVILQVLNIKKSNEIGCNKMPLVVLNLYSLLGSVRLC